MKRGLILVLAIALLVGVASYVSADVRYNRGGDARISIERHLGATTTAATLSTNISAGNLILGITFSDSAAGLGVIYDQATASSQANTEIIAEIKVAAGTAETIMLPLPYQVQNGLVMIAGNSTGVLIIYYE